MIMTSGGVRVVQNLTGDTEQLVQILKKASGELSNTDMQAGVPGLQTEGAEGNLCPELAD